MDRRLDQLLMGQPADAVVGLLTGRGRACARPVQCFARPCGLPGACPAGQLCLDSYCEACETVCASEVRGWARAEGRAEGEAGVERAWLAVAQRAMPMALAHPTVALLAFLPINPR